MTIPIIAGLAVILFCIIYLKVTDKKSKEKIKPQEELQNFRREYGVAQGLFCPQKDNEKYAQMVQDGIPLPDGIYEYKDGSITKKFYTVCAPELSPEEISELLTYKKLGYLHTIKNCAVYFVTLSIIGFCAYLVIIFQAM